MPLFAVCCCQAPKWWRGANNWMYLFAFWLRTAYEMQTLAGGKIAFECFVFYSLFIGHFPFSPAGANAPNSLPTEPGLHTPPWVFPLFRRPHTTNWIIYSLASKNCVAYRKWTFSWEKCHIYIYLHRDLIWNLAISKQVNETNYNVVEVILYLLGTAEFFDCIHVPR